VERARTYYHTAKEGKEVQMVYPKSVDDVRALSLACCSAGPTLLAKTYKSTEASAPLYEILQQLIEECKKKDPSLRSIVNNNGDISASHKAWLLSLISGGDSNSLGTAIEGLTDGEHP